MKSHRLPRPPAWATVQRPCGAEAIPACRHFYSDSETGEKISGLTSERASQILSNATEASMRILSFANRILNGIPLILLYVSC